MKVDRLPTNPIIGTHMDGRMGDNVNGPSLMRVPDWLPNPLGKYYLYFAHHRGGYIRLAYADEVGGPWQMYEPGTLRLQSAHCIDHVASPDVHVDADSRRIRMYYHGVSSEGRQRSRVALSDDGIDFTAQPESLGAPYFRVFTWRGNHYALAMPGIFYRSPDGLRGFEIGPTLFSPHMRHLAVRIVGETLHVFYSNAGDCPEGILHATVEMGDDWLKWTASEPHLVIEPEESYEGAALPLRPSVRGLAPEPVRELRDPEIFEEDGQVYLLYSVAGEQGIAIARLSGQ
jgi:hypothetical protein